MPAPHKRNDPRHKHPSTPASRRPSSASAPESPELIDPRWLLKALGVVFAVALLLSYATLCLLYYQGQWQLVLHPSRTVSATPASLGLAFTDLHFGVDPTGQPQLTGWYIPADNSATTDTALMFHGADGSIGTHASDVARGSDSNAALSRALTLHNAGLNVLLFDYRGYGKSLGQHPTQESMQTDAATALNFLVNTRHIAPEHIILYGQGVGASLAVNLAAQRHDIPAVILDAPDGDLLARAAHDSRSRLVPARLLFNQTFPLAAPLRTLSTPKLLITYNTAHTPTAVAEAANPKLTVELPSPNDPELLPAIQRFLSLYLPTH